MLLSGSILSPLFSVSKVSLKKLFSNKHIFYFPPQEVPRILRKKKKKKRKLRLRSKEESLLSLPDLRLPTHLLLFAAWVWILGVRFQAFSADVGAGWRAEVLPAWSGMFSFKGRA